MLPCIDLTLQSIFCSASNDCTAATGPPGTLPDSLSGTDLLLGGNGGSNCTNAPTARPVGGSPPPPLLPPLFPPLFPPGVPPPVLYDRDAIRSPIEGHGRKLSTSLHDNGMF